MVIPRNCKLFTCFSIAPLMLKKECLYLFESTISSLILLMLSHGLFSTKHKCTTCVATLCKPVDFLPIGALISARNPTDDGCIVCIYWNGVLFMLGVAVMGYRVSRRGLSTNPWGVLVLKKKEVQPPTLTVLCLFFRKSNGHLQNVMLMANFWWWENDKIELYPRKRYDVGISTFKECEEWGIEHLLVMNRHSWVNTVAFRPDITNFLGIRCKCIPGVQMYLYLPYNYCPVLCLCTLETR